MLHDLRGFDCPVLTMRLVEVFGDAGDEPFTIQTNTSGAARDIRRVADAKEFTIIDTKYVDGITTTVLRKI